MSLIYRSIEDINNRKRLDSRLLALDFVYKNDNQGILTRYVRCLCKCGVEKIMRVDGCIKAVSCGCFQKEQAAKCRIKYPDNIPAIHNSYYAMMARCYNEKDIGYKNYGGRGVKVCDEWKTNYLSFLKWAKENGWQPGLQLDKDIKGTDLLYNPETCCWVTNKENSNYRCNSVKYNYNGEILSLSQICRMVNISRSSISKRLNKGMSIEEAIADPIKDKNLNLKYNKNGKYRK